MGPKEITHLDYLKIIGHVCVKKIVRNKLEKNSKRQYLYLYCSGLSVVQMMWRGEKNSIQYQGKSQHGVSIQLLFVKEKSSLANNERRSIASFFFGIPRP